MADGFDQSKTEAPTQHRREEARGEGQAASSSDLASSLVLLAGLVSLLIAARSIAGALLENVRLDFLQLGRPCDLDPDRVQEIFTGVYGKAMELLGFVMAVLCVSATAVAACQVGFQVTPQVLAFNWERLSPALGWSRLASAASGVRGLVGLAKIAVVLAVAYWVLESRAVEIGALQQMTLASIVAEGWRMALHLALALAATLGIVGAADYFWQRWRFEQSLRMSRQEVKDEVKREEGDPQVKARVRKLHARCGRKAHAPGRSKKPRWWSPTRPTWPWHSAMTAVRCPHPRSWPRGPVLSRPASSIWHAGMRSQSWSASRSPRRCLRRSR